MLNSNLNFITSGGHGKRSDIPRIGLPLELPQDYSNTNKEVFVSSIILLLYKRVENTRENRREREKKKGIQNIVISMSFRIQQIMNFMG